MGYDYHSLLQGNGQWELIRENDAMYWFALQITKQLGIGSDGWTKVFAALGNRFFRKKYLDAPYEQRMLFLPFCLRDRSCPTEVTREEGLICPESCGRCRLGECLGRARSLGFMGAYIVPSSRILRGRDLLPSKDFIWAKIEQHGPAAALGAVCSRDFRTKYMKNTGIARGGVKTPSQKTVVVPQGLLLANNSCVKNSLNWQELDRLMAARSNGVCHKEASGW